MHRRGESVRRWTAQAVASESAGWEFKYHEANAQNLRGQIFDNQWFDASELNKLLLLDSYKMQSFHDT